MQVYSITFSNMPYHEPMQTGRPSKRPRTPFGERLLAARETAGLSQAQVAEKLGLTQNAYAYWERHPVALRPEQLMLLATIYGTSIEMLMGEANTKKNSGPSGRARQLFEAVTRLPRRQQQKVLEVVEAMVAQHQRA